MERNDGTTAIFVARMKNISTDLVYIDSVIRLDVFMGARCGVGVTVIYWWLYRTA